MGTVSFSNRTWLVMGVLGVTGQMVWAVSLTWFNTFVYDEISPAPGVVAAMTAVSALTAALAALLMGTWSDRSRSRWGRRRPFIMAGYTAWGLLAFALPAIAGVHPLNLAMGLMVLLAGVMTFFAATAHDGAFNPWTADIAGTRMRGRVEGVLTISLFIAQLLTLAAAGLLIDRLGYAVFFYALGGVVLLSGVGIGSLVQDAPDDDPQPAHRPSFWRELADLLAWRTLRQHPLLLVVLLNSMIGATGVYIDAPYLIIYLENNLGLSKSQFGLIGAIMLIGGVLLALPLGRMVDRFDKRSVIVAATLAGALGVLLFSFARSLWPLALSALLWKAAWMAGLIASGAWLKDLLPPGQRGRFMALRAIFVVTLPMIIGPLIGSLLIQLYGQPALVDGRAGMVPGAEIFRADAVFTLLALVPLWWARPGRANAAGSGTPADGAA